ncbi:uncharacterized protein LOC128262284 [Drosophila gunungcola]|uniref:Chromo shadow domain-containing protein n=1 Tax=Drosophila gunungcola TaxID=103775 RepID=A0A9P9YUE7_9MUSC|nr:uncharacterized protein LOC128262284 [Drosophila gunungcola]KAI8043271.1 hypothetical protein M5D96_004598 [Drosophila gunungcola]
MGNRSESHMNFQRRTGYEVPLGRSKKISTSVYSTQPQEQSEKRWKYILQANMEQVARKRRSPFTQDNKPVNKRTCNLPTKTPPSTLVQTVKKPFQKFSSDLANLPPIPAVDAFERGYQVETILDMVQNTFKESFLYIKFKDLSEPELVPLELAVERVPHLLSSFYQEYVQAWQKLEQQKLDTVS